MTAEHRYGGGLLKGQIGGLQGECTFRSRHILGESAETAVGQVPIYLITGPELFYVAADGFNTPGDVGAEDLVFWCEEPIHQADQEWIRPQQMPVTCRCRGRNNLYEYFIVLRDRLLNVFQFEYIG